MASREDLIDEVSRIVADDPHDRPAIRRSVNRFLMRDGWEFPEQIAPRDVAEAWWFWDGSRGTRPVRLTPPHHAV